jgi:BirA family biotin operon repressor/biotin-[acetyl-CoA-carboxylase] ligase
MNELPIRSPIGDAPIYRYDEVDSTMDEAERLAARGAVPGTVVVADYQHTGRGRRTGRRWIAPHGTSLMFTVVLDVADPDVVRTASIRAGLVVAMSLEKLCGVRPLIKWPNDVILGGKKVAGILCDYTGSALHVGIGVNLTQQSFDPEIVDSATSILLAGGRVVDRDELLLDVLDGMRDTMIDRTVHLSADRLSRAINERLYGKGNHTIVTLPDGTRHAGTIRHVDESGHLVIETKDGFETVLTGEMAFGASTERP